MLWAWLRLQSILVRGALKYFVVVDQKRVIPIDIFGVSGSISSFYFSMLTFLLLLRFRF